MTDENPSYPIEILPSKQGAPSLKINHLQIHSIYDPGKEADSLVQRISLEKYKIIFCFGYGLGYVQKSIIRRIEQEKLDIKLLTIEPAKEIDAYINRNNLVTAYHNHTYLSQIAGDWIKDALIQFLFLHQITHLSTHRIFIHIQSNYDKLYPARYFQFNESIKVITEWSISNQLTEAYFSKQWSLMAMRNLQNLLKCNSLLSLKGSLKGKAIAVISAGPSLNRNLEEIKKYKHYFFICAVDTALPVLIKSGIHPDFVVTLDAQYYNVKHFTEVLSSFPLLNTKLIADITSHNHITKLFNPSNIYFYATKNDFSSVIPWMDSFKYEIPRFIAGSSVAISALEFANYLEASVITLYGQDCAYTYLMSHATGSMYYSKELLNSKKKMPLASAIKTVFYRKDTLMIGTDRQILSTINLRILNRTIYNLCRTYKSIIYNRTNGGLDLITKKQTTNQEFDELVLSFNKAIDVKIGSFKSSEEQISYAILAFTSSIREELKAIVSDLLVILDQFEESQFNLFIEKTIATSTFFSFYFIRELNLIRSRQKSYSPQEYFIVANAMFSELQKLSHQLNKLGHKHYNYRYSDKFSL